MLDDREINRTKDALEKLEGKIRLIILKNGRDSFYAGLKQFAYQLASLSDLLTVEESLNTNSHIVPAILIANSSRQNIHYAALPRGAELDPFLRTIIRLGNGRNSLEEDTAQHLQAFDRDINIEVLINKSCPICPRMVELADKFALGSRRVKVWIIDVDHFPHIGRKYHALSAPTTVINGRAQIIGAVHEKELLSWIDKALSEEGLLEVLGSLLTIGNSQGALEIISKENKPQILIDLMDRKEFMVRLGAMVVMEVLQEKSPEKMRLLVPGLISLLSSNMMNIRGDAAFMLGKIGDRRAIRPLERLLTEENPDLVEIVEEALDALRNTK